MVQVGADAEGDVVEVDEQRRVGGVHGRGGAGRSSGADDVTVVHVVFSSRLTTRASSIRLTFPDPVIGKASKKRTRSGTL